MPLRMVALGGAVVLAGGISTAIAFAASDPPNPKSRLPANINPHKNPYEKKAPGKPPAEAPVSPQQAADWVKHFKAENPDGVICYKPDGSVGAWVLGERVLPGRATPAQKKMMCDGVAARHHIPGLHP